jgi:N-hydroxyarylamine O-acetyltransferase
MTSAIEDFSAIAGKRVLLIGRDPLVLETVTAELAGAGLALSGTTRVAEATEGFHAGNFDLIALGGGLDTETRSRLKRAFAEQNPQVRLLDATAPVAVRQILDALLNAEPAPIVDLYGYFARIGYSGPREATLEVLRALHELHPAAITFEAIDVLLGRGVDLSPAAVDAKLIHSRRGGYCFEQNGLFKRVLEELGFSVQGCWARVRWMRPPGAPAAARTHMVLKVALDGKYWLADVGFGTCVLPTPLWMDSTEPQSTRHESYRVFPFATATMLQARRDGEWLPVYEISPEPCLDADYEMANWFTSTHPSTHFRHRLIVARTTPEVRYALLENRFSIRRPGAEPEQRFLDAVQLEETLATIFGLSPEPDWRPFIERAAAAGLPS